MGILEEIVKKKKDHVRLKKQSLSLEKIMQLDPKYFEINNLESILGEKNILISEMKRKSPSGGILDKDLIPSNQADLYIKSGSDAISVLTEKDYFSRAGFRNGCPNTSTSFGSVTGIATAVAVAGALVVAWPRHAMGLPIALT